MTTLENLLGPIFAHKPRPKSDPSYGRFRRLVKKHGSTYEIADDGYVEIAPFGQHQKGLKIPHHDWVETFSRLEAVLDGHWKPDADGYVVEE